MKAYLFFWGNPWEKLGQVTCSSLPTTESPDFKYWWKKEIEGQFFAVSIDPHNIVVVIKGEYNVVNSIQRGTFFLHGAGFW